MAFRWLRMLWPEVAAVLLLLFLAGMLTGRALAEEPRYWPPCGKPGQDPLCPTLGPPGTCAEDDGVFRCFDGDGAMNFLMIVRNEHPQRGRTVCYVKGEPTPCEHTLPRVTPEDVRVTLPPPPRMPGNVVTPEDFRP